MAKFKIPVDLKSVSTEWPIAPAGTYPSVIKTAELKMSKRTNNPMVVLGLHPMQPLTCMAGQNQVIVEPSREKPLWNFYIVLTEAGAISQKQIEQAIGATWNMGQEIDTTELIGKQLNVTVSVETGDNGKPQQNIQNVSRL